MMSMAKANNKKVKKLLDSDPCLCYIVITKQGFSLEGRYVQGSKKVEDCSKSCRAVRSRHVSTWGGFDQGRFSLELSRQQ